MRHLLTAVFIVGWVSAVTAAPRITSGQAADTVRADGFSLVSKTELMPGGWDVWASKDGIAYEVIVDAETGRVKKAFADDPND